MFGPRSRVLGVGLVGLLVLSSAVVAVAGYSLSGSDAIETPTRTVTFNNNEYTIDAISRIAVGDSITVTSDVPDDESYFLNLRGPDNQIITREPKTGDSSHTFSYFGSGEAGTYAATIQSDGETLAAYPIVIAGYDIAVTSPNDVEAGLETTIEADVTELDVDRHSSFDRVQVVVGNEDVQVQQTLSQVDGNTYSASIDTDGIEPGTYNVYVVVRGDETVRQRDEILGVSDTVELTVTAQSSDTTSDDSDSSDGTTNPTSTETATPTSTDTVTATPTETATEAGTDTADGVGTSTLTATDAPSGKTTEPSGILQPTTPAETTTTSAEGPGFTLLSGLLALLLGIGVARRV